MYVCLCHGFTDRQVRAAITEGAGSTQAIFRHFDSKPRCGKCVSTVRELLDEGTTSGGCGNGPCPCGKRG